MAEEKVSFERKLEFLVEAQARASAQIEKVAEEQAILTRVMARLSERTKINEDHLEATMTVVEHVAERVDQIGQKLEQLSEIQKRNEEASEKRFRALDDRLNILVNVVEHHISGSGHQHLG